MTASILTILAALVPLLVDWLERYKSYDNKQKIRQAAASGDAYSLSVELDRLREKKRRLSGRK